MSSSSLGFLYFGVSKSSDRCSRQETPGAEAEEHGNRWKQTQRVATGCQHFIVGIWGKCILLNSIFHSLLNLSILVWIAFSSKTDIFLKCFSSWKKKKEKKKKIILSFSTPKCSFSFLVEKLAWKTVKSFLSLQTYCLQFQKAETRLGLKNR